MVNFTIEDVQKRPPLQIQDKQNYHIGYYQLNKKIIKEKNIAYQKQRKKTDPNFALICKLRNPLARAFKYFSKTGKIKSACEYGINHKAIIEHLKPFPKDIENYHIDHIIPLSFFDFNNPQEIKWAFEPENHQWLTIKQNLEKGNRLIMLNYTKS